MFRSAILLTSKRTKMAAAIFSLVFEIKYDVGLYDLKLGCEMLRMKVLTCNKKVVE